jgi:hypothetical protein
VSIPNHIVEAYTSVVASSILGPDTPEATDAVLSETWDAPEQRQAPESSTGLSSFFGRIVVGMNLDLVADRAFGRDTIELLRQVAT